jgi:hypothetical protein
MTFRLTRESREWLVLHLAFMGFHMGNYLEFYRRMNYCKNSRFYWISTPLLPII